MIDINKQIGLRIVQLRKERGWTQEELAAKLGMKRQNLGRIEQGLFNVGLSKVQEIAEVFGKELKIE